jgi:hypothetical protein
MSEGLVTRQDRRVSRVRRRAVTATALALVLGVAPAALAATPPETPTNGIPLESTPAVFETTAEIMARHERMSLEAPQETLDFFIGRQDSSGRKVDPEAEGRRQGPLAGPQSPAIASPGQPLAPQTVGVNANGPGSGASPCGTPPDTMGAVGPTQFISIVNCNVVSYNKSSGAPDGVLNTTPNNFFNSVRSSGTSDPHIRYDRTSQRWFLSIIDITFPNNRLLVAVSNTATITGATTWRFFFVQTGIGSHTNCFADYPTPGIDANAIYAGVNQFCGASLNTANYAGSDLFVIQKSSVLGAGPIHATGFPNLGSFTPQGVDNADPAATEGYVIATSNASWSQLDLFRVGTPGSSSPTLSPVVQISTANQGNPITQPHLGNTGGANGNIDGGDNRLFAATFRDGSLWTAMTVGTTVSGGNCVGTGPSVGTRDATFWWEFQGIPTGSTPSVNQAGVVCDTAATNPSFYSYATIAPNGQGQAAMGFTIAGSLNFLSAGTAGRLAGDTPGSLQAINVYAPGVAAYNPTWNTGVRDGYRRWGDFSFTSLDPCDDQSIWTIQEYTSIANQYGTRFGQLKAPPPATPASASPSTVASGQAAVNVVVTGTSSAGSGFFDTPSSLASEPCRTRITSSIPGLTVNSVTWNSPTQVTLILNTTAATSGTKTVTITNPDGQSASGSGILTITGSGCTPPATPVITTPAAVGAGSPNRAASVASHAGSTYVWTIGNGTITSGQGTSQISFTAGTAGTPLTLSVTETNSSGCPSGVGNTTVTVLSAGSALQFYTVLPCRILDTRTGSGFPASYGPPSMAGNGTQRSFVLAGQCGIPAGAGAVLINAAVWAPTTLGDLRVFPAGVATPLVSTLNWEPNILALANAALVPLSGTGAITVQVDGPGTVDIFFDVNGYFQ